MVITHFHLLRVTFFLQFAYHVITEKLLFLHLWLIFKQNEHMTRTLLNLQHNNKYTVSMNILQCIHLPLRNRKQSSAPNQILAHM